MSISALNAAVTGAQAAQQEIDVISNNISNAGTTGFKAGIVQTEDLFYRNLVLAGVPNNQNQNDTNKPVGVAIGSGVRVTGTSRDMAVGSPVSTNNPLDIALAGPGYFQISMPAYPNGRGFTRNGSFKTDNNGKITDLNGNPLADDITIPPGVHIEQISINQAGEVFITDSKNIRDKIGQITLYTFPNEQGLQPLGANMYVETNGSGEAIDVDAASVDMRSKYTEKSNVSTIKELMALVEAQRRYDMAIRVITTVTEMEDAMIKS